MKKSIKNQSKNINQHQRKFNLYTFFFLTILFIGLFLRTVNLNWGSPFYFHPDERNIATAVAQLSFPYQLNPHFFAYGSITIYLIYLFGIIVNLFINHAPFTLVQFNQAIISSRIISDIYSFGSLILVFIITKRLQGSALTSFFLAATSIGLIQFAHFGTVESSLTFYSLLLFYFVIIFLKKPHIQFFIIASIITGILVAIKISSLTLIPLPILALIFILKAKIKRENISLSTGILSFTFACLTLGLIIIGIFLITNPYSILDFRSFLNSMTYESSVGVGTLPVFYTGDFYNTIPVLYQFTSIYPFILNPFITILFIPGFILFCVYSLKNKLTENIFLALIFFLLFIPNAVLFTKWTRYIIPTLPFIYILMGILIKKLKSFIKYQNTIFPFIYWIILSVSFVWSFAFVTTVYLSPDTRIAAAQYAKQHIPVNANIISETYDLGLLPFNQYFSNIDLVNFYEMENNQDIQINLNKQLRISNYIILPSQRIIASRLSHPHQFPIGHSFYHDLSTGKLGYKLIYQTPCNFLCRIVYLNNPVSEFEQTATVFDHPTVFIYQKKS